MTRIVSVVEETQWQTPRRRKTPCIHDSQSTQPPQRRAEKRRLEAGRGDSAAHPQSIKRAYARYDTNVWIPLPGIPFSSNRNVPEHVHFTRALRNAFESVRVACDGNETDAWTRGCDNVLERRVLRSVRVYSAKAAPMKIMVTDAFAQGGKLLNAGQNGQEVFDHILRALRMGLRRASPAQ